MIPKIIHYCWFGRGAMPQQVKDCMASWYEHMPDYDFRLWNEDNVDIESVPYAKEAYAAGIYAFVSDYVRLWALCNEGGLYLDTDVMVFKSFDNLLEYKAFAGFEGSKRLPVGTCVMASEAHGEWVTEMLGLYHDRHFVKPDGTGDMTSNVQLITGLMASQGFRQDGTEQDYKDLHVFPVEFFCPMQTTGEYFRTENTYCDHLGVGSWAEEGPAWKRWVKNMVGQRNMTRLIKLKRKLFS